MKKTTLSLFAIAAMTTSIWATVPYEFIPSTPAKASEVNANFSALSDKISTLENNVSNNSDAIIKEGTNCSVSPFTYTYQHTPSNIGDSITISGEEYIIVAMPFVEHATGDKYYIKYPVKNTSTDENIPMSLYSGISTHYINNDDSCYPNTFAGYPANVYNNLGYFNSYNAQMEDPAGDYTKFRTSSSVSGGVLIKVNQTVINIYTYITKEIQDSLISSGDVDMRDDINWSEMYTDTALVESAKTLMNYIEIVKIP